MLPPPIDSNLALKFLKDYLLGEDWYVAYSAPSSQINTEIVYSILKSYSKKFRKELKREEKNGSKWARTSYIECTGTAEEINSIWDDNDNEIPLVELADKIPEGRFRDLYVKYISKVITEAVDAYVKKNSLDYEIDWSAFEPDY